MPRSSPGGWLLSVGVAEQEAQGLMALLLKLISVYIIMVGWDPVQWCRWSCFASS